MNPSRQSTDSIFYQAAQLHDVEDRLSFFDAMRFVNWLENGQPTDGSGTESGVYTIGESYADRIVAIVKAQPIPRSAEQSGSAAIESGDESPHSMTRRKKGLAL